MGDYVDHRGNVMPAPGNGRPKRLRVDKEDNVVAEDVYVYLPTDSTDSVKNMTFSSDFSPSAGDIPATTAVTFINRNSGLANGTYTGQRKTLVGSSGTHTITPASTTGWTSVRLEVGQTASLVWTAANQWALVSVGTSSVGGRLPIVGAQVGTVQTITADGVDITATAEIVLLNPPPAVQITTCALPDGVYVGEKKILIGVNVNTGPVTPSLVQGSFLGSPGLDQISFQETGACATVVWTGAKWAIVGTSTLETAASSVPDPSGTTLRPYLT